MMDAGIKRIGHIDLTGTQPVTFLQAQLRISLIGTIVFTVVPHDLKRALDRPDNSPGVMVVNRCIQVGAYIALGNEVRTDVVLYPDSGKYGAWHGDPGDPDGPGSFRVFAREESAVDYWDGETDS